MLMPDERKQKAAAAGAASPAAAAAAAAAGQQLPLVPIWCPEPLPDLHVREQQEHLLQHLEQQGVRRDGVGSRSRHG